MSPHHSPLLTNTVIGTPHSVTMATANEGGVRVRGSDAHGHRGVVMMLIRQTVTLGVLIKRDTGIMTE